MIESTPERAETRQRYAEVLDKCQDIAVIFSNSQLAELFEHAGTALLDFAERAESNSMQGRFFEAMGLIQRRRADMERIYRHEIDRGFRDFGHRDIVAQTADSDAAGDEDSELSLVAPEDMEESVAAENIIIKASASLFPELYALSHRLAFAIGQKKLKDEDIPAGPHHLVHAFRSAIGELEIEVKIKVILYALYDKFVIKRTKSLYDEINGALKDAGVLPDLKPVHSRAKDSSGPSQAEAEQQAQEPEQAGPPEDTGSATHEQVPASLGAELFDSIIEIMSKRHGASRRAPGSAAAAARGAAGTGSGEVIAAVGRVQSSTTPEMVRARVAEAAAIPNVELDTVFIEKVKRTLSQERREVISQIDPDKLSPMDADLIDLIGMLFEYMLNDPVLPNVAKALLSHLHTPYLKLAVIDRSLLVDAQHPARRLLNQMVEAGNLWIDENNPKYGIFPAMQQVVDRVLQEFTNDVAVFDVLLSFFEQSMKAQQRKTDTMEQRTKEAARGREKLQLAKRRATQQIRELIRRTPLPEPVAGFLSKTWLDRLVFILLREKDEDRGQAWMQAVRIAEDLVALFQPGAGAKLLNSQPGVIPDLRARINEEVQRMGTYAHASLDALFSLLDAPETWEEFCAEAAQAKQSDEKIKPQEPAAPEEALADQAGMSQREQEIIARLRKMKFGTWFEFRSATGGATRRIKLSWLSPLTATCMFVDRSGMQAEIKTLKELANEILSGRARVIPRPKHPFIERALVSIRNMLQRPDSAAPTGETPQP